MSLLLVQGHTLNSKALEKLEHILKGHTETQR